METRPRSINTGYFILTLATVAYGWLLLDYPFFFDDAFISMRISRNWAEGHGLFHNLEEKVQTNTSLIFPILTAPFHFFSKGIAIRLTLWFDLFISWLNVILLFRMTLNLQPVGPPNNVSKIVIAGCLGVIFYTYGIVVPGMETQVYVFILLSFLVALTAKKDPLGIGLAASFIRPEGALIALVWHGSYFPFSKLTAKKWVRFFLWASLAGLAYMWMQWTIFHEIIPHTIAVKWHIRSNWLDSLGYFLFSELFPSRYPLRGIVAAGALYTLWEKRTEPFFQFIGAYLGLSTFFYVFLSGGASFFHWYFAPLKAIFTLLFSVQLFQLLPFLQKNRSWMIPGSALLGWAMYTTTSEAIRYRQDGIFTAARQLNHLTQNKSYIVTCEPIGILGYYNPNCSFRDYPGLASKISLNILKEAGPVDRKMYFNNKVFAKIIAEAGTQLVLLTAPELEAYKSLMDKNFVFVTEIGLNIPSEDNSNFFVFANPKTLKNSEIENLKKQAAQL